MMNNCDLILCLIDKYIVEKEQNIILQQRLEQSKQTQNSINVKAKKQ